MLKFQMTGEKIAVYKDCSLAVRENKIIEITFTLVKKRMCIFSKILSSILFFISISTFGQINCDTLSREMIKKYDSISQRKFKKLLHQRNLSYFTAYEIATYFRLKKDTTCNQWYRRSVELTKNKVNYLIRKRLCVTKYKFYVIIGMSNFYLNNFEKAYLWLTKYKPEDDCTENFIKELKNKLEIKDQ